MAIVPDFDPTTPSIARVYDYLLDGKDNFAVDREVAQRMMAVAPLTAEVTRENRQFLARAVAWAANRGITQFIDLGCGLPTAPNTHETARAIAAGARVAYLDNDAVVLSHLHALAAKGNPGVTVVDDGSTDDTTEAAKHVGDPRVTVLGSPTNEGVGGAMARGFEHALAQGDGIIVKMDGDGQMDPADLPRLLEPIVDGRCDYAKGNRFLRSRELDIMPRARLAGNFVLTFLTKLASGYWNVFDPQNGYLAITSSTLRLLDLGRLSRRYFFENDMLINLNIFDARVCDVAMPSRYGTEWRALASAHGSARSCFSTCGH